ncbi:MAG: hypothetical protein ACI4PF_00325 [Christensenellales bacterium]
MSKELTIFQQMTVSTESLIKVVNKEIATKCCMPFAIRALEALNSLGIKTEAEAKKASNVFLDNLQTLIQGGITTEDYDKIDLVKRGKVITLSARVQAFIRACKRKGFTLIETIIGVPQGDNVYFEEIYKDGVGIIYLLKDSRVNPNRDITAERLINNYFERFICRLEIRNNKTGEIIMTATDMTNQEIMNAQACSENGLYESEWKSYKDENNQIKKYKVVYDGSNDTEVRVNKNSIWFKWTSEMVKKTILRRALKNLKESLPELYDTIMAFDKEFIPTTLEDDDEIKEVIIDVDGVTTIPNVNLQKLTEEQQKDVNELFEIYKQNPANAMQDAEKIKELYESGKPIYEIINEYYAELVNLSKSKNTYPLIKNILEGVPYEESKN